MKQRSKLSIILLLSASPAIAARYSSPGEAFFCGFLQCLLLGGVIWAIGYFRNKKNNNDNDK